MKSPPTPEALSREERRAEQAIEGRAAMAEYRQAERDRVARIAHLRQLRLEKKAQEVKD
jgi:hypothetical protein